MKKQNNQLNFVPRNTFYTPRAWMNRILNLVISLFIYASILAFVIFLANLAWRTVTLSTLYRQMQAAVSTSDWETVREKAVEINRLDINYRDTQTIYLDSMVQEALQSIQNGDFVSAQSLSATLYDLKPDYKDVSNLQCNAWYQPAYQQVTSNDFASARSGLSGFLLKHTECAEALDLYLNSYLQQGQVMIQTKAYMEVVPLFAEYAALPAPFNALPAYVKIGSKMDSQLYDAYQQSMGDEDWEPALEWAFVIGKTPNGSGQATDLSLETYYRPAIALKNQKNWKKAAEAFVELYQLNPDYKDTRASLLSVYYAQAGVEKLAAHQEEQVKWLQLAAAIDPNYQNCAEEIREINIAINQEAWLKAGFSGYSRQLHKHNANVRDLQFSPDGSLLLSASVDKITGIWDTSTWTLKNTLKGHTEPVFALSISSDSLMAVTVSLDRTASLWGLATGRQTIIRGHSREVISAAFSPIGKMVATGSMDRMILLSDTSGHELGQLIGHKGDIYSLAFSSDGKYLASTGEDRTVIIWNVSSKSVFKTFKIGFTSKQLRFSHDGKYLAVLESKASLIHLIDMSKWTMKDIELDFVPTDIAWTPDDQQMLPVAQSIVWVTTAGKELKRINVSPGVASIDISPDASAIALGLSSGEIEIITVNK